MDDVGSVWKKLSDSAPNGNYIDSGTNFMARILANVSKNHDPSVAFKPSQSVIGEASFKEVMPCEISPLGFHLASSVKEKI